MALTYRASATGNASASTTVTINKPTGTAENDLLVAVIATTGTGEPQTESGWTREVHIQPGSTYWLSIYTKVAGASEPSSYTFDLSASDEVQGAVLAYSGVDTTTPLDVKASTDLSDVAPAVTTTANDETVLRICGADTGATLATPAGTTSRVSNDDSSTEIKVVDETQATAGSTGTADFASSGFYSGAATLAFKNAAGGGGSSQPAAFALFV